MVPPSEAWEQEIFIGTPTDTNFSTLATGLLFGVQYAYRVFASNGFGTAWSATSTVFKTLDPLGDDNPAAWLYATQRSDGTNVLNSDTNTVSLDWHPHTLNSAIFSHSTGTADEVTELLSGDYFVAFTLPLTNINDSANLRRTCIRAELYLNGVAQGTLGAIGESSFIRGHEDVDNGHYNSSDHFATLINNGPAGSVFEVRTVSTATESDDVVMEQASLYLERVDEDRELFAAVTTDGGQEITPTSARTIAWEETVRTNAGYTFTNPSNIVLDAAGTYLVFINMPYSSTDPRDAAKLNLQLDGVTVPGGLAMQGYIRDNNGHNA
ncbi:MAG: hypothetical protein AAF492_32885, partial [Verrucomicrobiota bacterium]